MKPASLDNTIQAEISENIVEHIVEARYDIDMPIVNYYYWVATFCAKNSHLENTHPTLKKLAGIIANHPSSIPGSATIEEVCTLFFTDKELLRLYYTSIPAVDKAAMDSLIWNDFIPYVLFREYFNAELINLKTLSGLEIKLVAAHSRWDLFMKVEEGFYNDENDYYEDVFNEADFYEEGDDFIDNSHLFQDSEDHPKHAIDPAREGQPALIDAHILDRELDGRKICFQMPAFMRLALREVADRPEGYELHPFNLPENYIKFEGESSIFHELPVLLLEISLGHLKLSQNRFLNLASLKKTQRKLALDCFPDDTGYIKTLLLASHLTGDRRFEPAMDPLKVLSYIFEDQPASNSMVDAALFPFKGIRKLSYYDIKDYNFRKVTRLLSKMPKDKWVSVANIHRYVHCHFFDICPIEENCLEELTLTAESPFKNEYNNGTYLEQKHIINQYFVTGVLLTAAAFGLLDLAYPPENPRDDLPPAAKTAEGSFVACRITRLGEYLFQDREDYALPDFVQPIQFELDQNSLIIHVTGKLELAAGILKDWAKTIPGKTDQLQLDIATIVFSCNNKQDLRDSMEQFCQTVSMDMTALPNYWKIQLMALVDKFQAVQSVALACVFKLSPYDKDLHSLFTQDPILKSITIKGEQYTVIVSINNEAQFINRLAHYGYSPQRSGESNPALIKFVSEKPSKETILDRFQQLLEQQMEENRPPSRKITPIRKMPGTKKRF